MLLEEILKDEKGIDMGDGTLYQLLINEDIKVHIRSFSGDRFFYRYAKVGRLPEGVYRTELLEILLEANLFSQACGGAFFSWHKESNTLVLMEMFDTTIVTYEQYSSRLQDFVDHVIYWRKKLEKPTTKNDRLKLMSQKRIFP